MVDTNHPAHKCIHSIYLININFNWYNLRQGFIHQGGKKINKFTMKLKIHYSGYNSTIKFLTIPKVGTCKKIIL